MLVILDISIKQILNLEEKEGKLFIDGLKRIQINGKQFVQGLLKNGIKKINMANSDNFYNHISEALGRYTGVTTESNNASSWELYTQTIDTYDTVTTAWEAVTPFIPKKVLNDLMSDKKSKLKTAKDFNKYYNENNNSRKS